MVDGELQDVATKREQRMTMLRMIQPRLTKKGRAPFWSTALFFLRRYFRTKVFMTAPRTPKIEIPAIMPETIGIR